MTSQTSEKPKETVPAEYEKLVWVQTRSKRGSVDQGRRILALKCAKPWGACFQVGPSLLG